jgi:hypothetical protein
MSFFLKNLIDNKIKNINNINFEGSKIEIFNDEKDNEIYGSSEMIGKRDKLEDFKFIEIFKNFSLFCLFDGHGIFNNNNIKKLKKKKKKVENQVIF